LLPTILPEPEKSLIGGRLCDGLPLLKTMLLYDWFLACSTFYTVKFDFRTLCLLGLCFTGIVCTDDIMRLWLLHSSRESWLWLEGLFVALSLAFDELLSLIGDVFIFFYIEII
jgi:hypothetical protein